LICSPILFIGIDWKQKMNKTLYLATNSGVMMSADAGESWQNARRSLEGNAITCIAAQDGIVLAGTRDGVYRSTDLGLSWEAPEVQPDIPHLRWLSFHPDQAGLAFAGTEPAGIFVTHDGGKTWRPCPEVIQLRQRYHWSLPYSPEAGCVRGFAFHGRRVYAAVEVGGVLVSDDFGENWRLAEGSRGDAEAFPQPSFIHSDVHSIEAQPSSSEMVAAPTGGGFFVSRDAGASWTSYYRCYCRAVWLDPDNPEHMILGPAGSVDRDGRIEATWDGGRTWQDASAGLATPWQNHMVERFVQVDDQLFAVLSNGELIASPLSQISWSPVLSGSTGVNTIAWQIAGG
jgi:photosystem II stability/assembly factor-like uncharacterized protein